MKYLFITSLAFFLAFHINTQELSITCDDWPPWQIGNIDKSKPAGGIAIDIVKAILDDIGIKYHAEMYPFMRTLAQIKHGEKDLIVILAKNKEREQYMLFSDPYITDNYYLYYDKTRLREFDWSNYSQLKQYTIGIVTKFNYGDEFHNSITQYKIKTDEVLDNENNIKKLISNRVDFIVINKSNADKMIKTNQKYQNITYAKKIIKTTDFRLAISKKSKHTALMKKINISIRKLKKNGTIEKIYKKYL